jgi:hypothetical protein
LEHFGDAELLIVAVAVVDERKTDASACKCQVHGGIVREDMTIEFDRKVTAVFCELPVIR